MPKLNKRQIIIIIIAAMVILYGAYEFLSGGASKKEVKMNTDPLEKSVLFSALSSDLMREPVSVAEAYVIGRAEAEWSRNPFWEKGSYKEWAGKDNSKTSDDPTAKLIYSGYVDAGKKKMAVINGLEYSVGDQLVDMDGYFLRKITTAKIILSNKKSGSVIEITIQE
jgi:hypothetical protein